MVWKRLDDPNDYPDLAEVSLSAVGLWAYIVGHADVEGRFIADPDVIRSKLSRRPTLRRQDACDALADLAAAGAIHLYTSEHPEGHRTHAPASDSAKHGSPTYGVIHDFARRHIPPGALRYNTVSKVPAPPIALCVCLSSPSLAPPKKREAREAPPPRRPSSSSTPQEGGVGGGPPPSRSCGRCRGVGMYMGEVHRFGNKYSTMVQCECRGSP